MLYAHRKLAALVLALSGALVAGCNVGHPIVDTQPVIEAQGIGPIRCNPPPDCSLQISYDDAEPRAATPIDTTACGDPSGEMARALNDLPATPLHCKSLRLTSDTEPGDGASSEHVLERVEWTDTNVVFESKRAITLVLRQPALKHVHLQVGGPVTLRVEEATRFDDVSLDHTAMAGRPRVVLDRDSGEGFLVSSREQPFAGSLQIKRGTLTAVQIASQDLAMESVIVTGQRILADQLLASDVELMDTVVESSVAQISASELINVDVPSCSSLVFIDSHLTDSLVAACDGEPLRVYGGIVAGGVFDGEIESDDAAWGLVAFGARTDTSLVIWKGSVRSSNFCAHTLSAKFGLNVQSICSRCDQGGLAAPGAVCNVPDLDPSRFKNACPAFDHIAWCQEPIPVRARPDHLH